MKSTKKEYRKYKPTVVTVRHKQGIQKDTSTQKTQLQTAMKNLESQGLQAIAMLKDMQTMLDSQVEYKGERARPSEQLKKLKGERTNEGAIKNIQEKNSKIRDVLSGINNGKKTAKDYDQILQLEAIFEASNKGEVTVQKIEAE
eukprot:TRINITY_DN15345_c0_g1_i3.p1 TRINITY_DN15345_c0_g1~~TRINITY_DN15345_c0_g1_i3.p1  ORF type:complete len:144 (-),score=43.96 TRINITY_DN15345_c0_g1_i3:184-615(-)